MVIARSRLSAAVRGLIGDPSGKSQERTLMTPEMVEVNLQGIKSQLEKFLDFDSGDSSAVIDNNAAMALRDVRC